MAEKTDANKTPEGTYREQIFIDALKKLDTGKLAVLRRNAGNSLAETKGFTAWFYGLPFAHTEKYEEAYFLVATLFASDKDAIEGKNNFTDNFGTTLCQLRRKLQSESGKKLSDDCPLDRRFNTLLDADFDPYTGGELMFRLRQMTKRVLSAKDKTVSINWSQLLYDLKRWNNTGKTVQKQWARSYYAPAKNTTEDSTENSSKVINKGDN